MSQLQNCPRCDKLFVKSLRDVCQDCFKQEEEDYQKVYQFVRKRENRMASIKEVEEGTGVEEKFIIKFVKQGRISVHSFPNLAYPCESCGRMIHEGRICDVCRGNINTGLDRIDSEKRFTERRKREENSKYTTYHSIDAKINKDKK